MSKKKENEVTLTVETGVEEPKAQEAITEVEAADTGTDAKPEGKSKPRTRKKADNAAEKASNPHPADETLRELIKTHGTEEAQTASGKKTLGMVLGGDILTSPFVRRQIGLLIIMTVFIIAYISNGYKYRKSLITIDTLTTNLKNAKIESLTSTSDLTKLTRETHVLEMLKENNDTLLKRSNVPPTIIYDTQE